VAVTAKDGVPLFGPTLPKPAVFSVDDPRSFRDFFLSKRELPSSRLSLLLLTQLTEFLAPSLGPHCVRAVINAELAAYRTASFSRKLRVARRAMLDDISLKYWT
jgi:hypothetical protein